MKILIILNLLFSIQCLAYYAEVRPLNKSTEAPLFKIEFSEKIIGEKVEITALFKSNDTTELIETALVDLATADFSMYNVDQKQTKEKGHVDVIDSTVKIKYEVEGKPPQTKELKKPNQLVAPANFDRWLKKNFAQLQKEKSMQIDFLVWDRLDIYKFKVRYLGLQEKEGRKIQRFKMSIDNFLLSAFVDPIEIDMNEDMTQLVHFKGRVAVKQKKGNSFENLDADVKYFYN